jgi:hypothetical protein
MRTGAASSRAFATSVLIVLGTAASYVAGWAVGVPILVPVLNAVPAVPFLVGALRRGAVAAAIARMAVWALTLLLCGTLFSYASPSVTGTLFLHGHEYREEMFQWIQHGEGREGDPSRFLPQHAWHATVFSGLALATGGLAALPMGAALMNYMGHYVGALAAAGARPATLLALGWVPWALIRVASFLVLGVVLGGPVLGRLFRFPFRLADHAGWLRLALAGLIVDAALKWLLAPSWRQLLRQAAGW